MSYTVYNIVVFSYSEHNSLVLEESKWSWGDSGRPAKAHKVLIECVVKNSDLVLLQEQIGMDSYVVSWS